MKTLQELKKAPAKIYLRYALLNTPGAVLLLLILLVVREHLSLPGWFMALLLAAWIVKDMILFPFIWRSYDWDRPGISRSMTGSVGIVKQPLSPLGFVQINGELWRAEAVEREKIIGRGTTVRVVRRDGLTVQVVPHEPGSECDSSRPARH